MTTDGTQAPARPLRADARRNRELLLAAARAVFAVRGLDAPLDGLRTEAAHPLPGRPLDPATVRAAMSFD
jgi:hypothetical protein